MGNVTTRRAPRVAKRWEPGFNAQAFLDSALVARSVTTYARGESIFAQGDACMHVMYIQSGGVKLSVVSEHGKEAVVAMLGPGDFFGEGCLAGQKFRMAAPPPSRPARSCLSTRRRWSPSCISSTPCPIGSFRTC